MVKINIRKSEPILGLDISADFIKAVELQPIAQGIKINGFGSVETPSYSIKEGVIVNPNAVSKTIVQLLSTNHITARKVIASVRSPYALLRLSRLPFMSREQAHIALGREISQYTVFKNKEAVHDIHIVEEISEEGTRKMNVLFAVTPHELCDSYLKVAANIGLELLSIDMSTLAVMRSISQTNLKAAGLQVAMMVAINPESIDMCVLKGESIRFCHTVKVDTSQMVKDLDGFVERVTAAFKLVLNFYQAKYAGGEAIAKVILACDSYSCVPLREKLGQRLKEISIEIGDPAGYMTFDQNRISMEKVGQLRSFACAIGSGLQAGNLSSYQVSLNLIPPERARKVELTKIIRFFNIILAGALSIFLVYASSLFIANKSLEGRIARAKRELTRPDPLLAKVNAIFEERNRVGDLLENRTLLLNIITISEVSWDRVFVNAVSKVPDELWIVDIANREGGIHMRGMAYSEEPIFNFVATLDDSFYFESAKLVSSQNVKVKGADVVEFRVDCMLRQKKQAKK